MMFLRKMLQNSWRFDTKIFHENPEDIEGHGEDTGLLEDQMAIQQALQQPNNGNQ